MKLLDDKECHTAFGKYIKDIRERNGLNQREIAEKMGVSQVLISYIERGERDVDLGFAFRLCNIVGADMEDFIKLCKETTA